MSESAALKLFDALLDLAPAQREARLCELDIEQPECAVFLRRWLHADRLDDGRWSPGRFAPLATVEAAPDASPGDSIGVWRLIRELGRGGMGSVWLAERSDGQFDQRAALKLMRIDLLGADARARFVRERQILARLNHAHIAHLLDGGIGPTDQPWLAMEYVEGRTLRAVLADGLPSSRQTIAWAAQIAAALAHAHSAGIVHRDLKPDNVLVAGNGQTKLLDFGVAKLVAGPDAEATTGQATAVGSIVGTPAYMSPEQASGQTIDFRSDQFAFGAMLYEMASGRRAFARATPTDTFAAVLRDEPEALETAAPNLPPALGRIVRRCLAKNPNDRYASTLDLAHDLREFDYATPHGLAAVAVLPRPRWGWAQAVLAAVLLATLVAAWTVGRLGVAPAPVPGELRAHIQIAPAEQLHFGPFPVPALALSPNGRDLVYAGRIGTAVQLYRRSLAELQAIPIPGTEGAVNPIFSPDGAWIAFFADQKLKKIVLAGGSATALADAPFPLGGLVWTESDHIIYAPIPNSGLHRVSAQGGPDETLTVPDIAQGESGHSWPTLIDQQRVLLFCAEIDRADSFDGASLIALDLASGRRKVLLSNASYPRSLANNRLSYVRTGTVYVADFDAERLALRGAPTAWLQGIAYSPASGSAQFALADNGLSVFLPGADPTQLRQPLWVSRAGKSAPLPLPPRQYERARLSPDATRVALQIGGADDDLWIFDLQRQALSRLTHSGENIHPAWSPDSRRIAYSHHSSGPPNLYVMAADGSGATERLTESERVQYANDWSPDGRLLVFEQEEAATATDIWLYDFETRSTRPFRQTPAQEQSAEFSPDGRWLAYQSNESGRDEIYVQTAQGSERRWQVSIDGGSYATWSPDGRDVLFKRGSALFSANVVGIDQGPPAAPQRLFEGSFRATPQFAADGQRLLLLRNEAAPNSSGPLVVVQGLLPPSGRKD